MANDVNNNDNKQNEGNENNKAAEQNNSNNTNNANNGNGNNSNSSANNTNNGQNNNNGGNSSNGSNNQGGKSFSQDEVNRMMAKEKQQGRNSVFNELGINPDDSETMELIKALIAVKSNSGSNNSGKEMAQNNADFEAAKERAVIAELKLDAIKAGVSPQYVDDAVDLALARFTGENDDINTILSELKPKYPIWFNDSDESENNAGKKGTGSSLSSNKNGGGKSNEQVGIGKRLAGMRKPTQQKKSYFSS